MEKELEAFGTIKRTEATKTASESIREKFKIVFTNITVEPVFVLYLLPSTMAGLVIQNLNLEKACRVNLQYGNEICNSLSNKTSPAYNENAEITVQKLVASLYAWKNVVQSLIPTIILIFLGSWSDRHKRRKPCIIIPIIGEAVASVGFLVCTYFFYELSVEYNIISEAIPPAVTGGWFALFMGVYSYVSELSSVEARTVRIGAISTFSNVSYTVGIALSGVLFNAIGFYGVFTLALCLYTAGIMYGLIVIKEEPMIATNEKTPSKKGFFRDFFDISHISDTMKVVFRNGEKRGRKKICTIMILVMVIIGPLHGEYTVMYLFVRYKFHWNEVDYSIYCTYSAILYTLATIFCLSFFSKYLKMDDALLGAISSTCKVLSALVFAFAPNATIFYLGALIDMFNCTSFIVMRSIISKLVPPDELGKVNSVFGICEALMPLVYGPMYSMIYKWTIRTLPGAFYLFGGAFTTPAVVIFFWLYIENRKEEKLKLEARRQSRASTKTVENGKKY